MDKTVYEAADALMVVEVASPSRPGIDRITKPAAYGKAGIPYYLLVESDDGAVSATAYALTPAGVYAESARSDPQRCARPASTIPALDRPHKGPADEGGTR